MRRIDSGAGYKGLRAGLVGRSAPRPRTIRKSGKFITDYYSEFLSFAALSKSDDSTFTESRSDHFFGLLKPEALSGLFLSLRATHGHATGRKSTDLQKAPGELFPPPLLPRTICCSIALMLSDGTLEHGHVDKARTCRKPWGTFFSPTITQNYLLLDCVNAERRGTDMLKTFGEARTCRRHFGNFFLPHYYPELWAARLR